MTDLFVKAPPPEAGELFPRPYDRDTRLRDRVTGYAFRSHLVPVGTYPQYRYVLEAGDPAPGIIRYLPAPPAGERWITHPWAYTPQFRYHLLSGDDACLHLGDYLIGCSVADACPSFCVWTDGCPDCRGDDWQWCPTGHCGGPRTEEGRISLAEYPEGDCECYTTCDHCGNRVEHPNEIWVEQEGSCDICDNCVRRLFTVCPHCDHWYRDSTGHDCDDCDCGDCGSCDRRRSAGGLINYYSYKPVPIFHGPGPVYLGVEMEIDTGDSLFDVARFVADKVCGFAYMKEDSSIGDGFELVTHPLDYGWSLEHFPWEMFAEMRDRWGLHNGETCGIHVHVNRDGFTDQRHVYRWLKFVYRNQEALTALSRRRNGQLAEWGGFRPDSRAWAIHHAKTGGQASRLESWADYQGNPNRSAWWATRDKRDAYGFPHYAARYSAINVSNEHTFELRFFAGSVYASQVKAAMGFAHASVEYTRQLTTREILTGNGWDWSGFTAYLASAPDDIYAPLRREIERLVTV